MYMKLKKKLKLHSTAWDNALQYSLIRNKKCLCGKILHECSDAYSHMTQGY